MKQENLNEKLNKIKMIVFDVDGVLTDGKIYLPGEQEEIKVFYAKDAPRTATALRSGLKIVWLTARKGAAVIRRAKALKVEIIFKQDLKENNISLLETVKDRFNVGPEEILYVGDDWSDLHLMKQVAVAVTPNDGSKENKEIAHIVTEAKGGQGVAAEIIEKVMRAKGTWDKYSQQYLSELIY